MKNVRIFDKIISVPVILAPGTVIQRNVQNYFPANPFVSKNRVKAISITNITSLFSLDVYLTLVDSNNQSLINNYPCLPLTTSNALFPDLRLTYFDIINLDLSRSYWVYGDTTPVTGNPFNINFYF